MKVLATKTFIKSAKAIAKNTEASILISRTLSVSWRIIRQQESTSGTDSAR